LSGVRDGDRVAAETKTAGCESGEAALAAKTLLECSFLIPTRRDKNLSNGKAHGRRAWKWLEDRLDDFGGATQALTLYSGW
jgi:hypothetical protein